MLYIFDIPRILASRVRLLSAGALCGPVSRFISLAGICSGSCRFVRLWGFCAFALWLSAFPVSVLAPFVASCADPVRMLAAVPLLGVVCPLWMLCGFWAWFPCMSSGGFWV